MNRSLALTLAVLALVLPAHALDLSALEKLPVQEGGRKKPYLVFAQESLLSMSGRTAFAIDGEKKSAMEIITSLWLAPEGWNEKPLILIDDLPLKKEAGLDESEKRFSHATLAGSPQFIGLLQKAEIAKGAAKDGKVEGMDKKVGEIGFRVAKFEGLRNGSLFRIVANPAGAKALWMTLNPDDPTMRDLRAAFASGDQAAFDQAAQALVSVLAERSPEFHPPEWKLALEALYQKAHPFRWAWIFYLCAAIALAVTSIRGRAAGYALGWVFAGIGFAFQLAGFVSRIVIAGRPPVTNMYESIIWVAFGCVLFALIFEAIYRGRYFLLGAAPVAVLSLMLADSQPLALNSAIEPLVPVLQSNFWLSTHVLTITLSYAAFLLALGVGHIALGKVIFGRKPSPALYNYIYRTLQVGVLLLAIGTILGGVWANYSWGRFWDWDPKETWALVALLAYLFLLHGRIAGKWGGFGLAVGSVLGFLTIVMAWYGVNFVLGVGLHSYGFGSGGFGYAIMYVAAELVFVGVAIYRKATMKSNASRSENLMPTAHANR